jgi:uncharacterized membrane protein
LVLNQTIVLCTLLSLAATAAFVWWELRVAQPIVDLQIWARPAVAAALAIVGAYAAIIFPAFCSCRSLRSPRLALPARWPAC